MKLLIENESKRLRYNLEYGIRDYHLEEDAEIPEGYEVIESEINLFAGMFLPAFINEEWEESATQEEIKIIMDNIAGEGNWNITDDTVPEENPIQRQISNLQLAVVEIFEEIITLQEDLKK